MTVKTTKFKQPTIGGTVQQLADHMPRGEAWGSKLTDGTVLNSVMYGAAKPFNITQGRIADLARDFDINQTVELISDWETSVDLPDDCFGIVSDIDERRELVSSRFSRKSTVTLQEQQDYLNTIFPGGGLVLTPGEEYYPSGLPGINVKFVIVVVAPPITPFFQFDWEIDFTGGPSFDTIICVMERITPANVLPIYVEGQI